MSGDPETTTEHLLLMARQGEMDALGLLLDQYRGYLKLLARLQIHRRLQAKADASDAVQETFLQAHRSFDQFRGVTETELLHWLRQIMASRIASLVRHYYGTQQRDPRLEREISDELDRSSQALNRSFVVAQSSPSRSAARREQSVILSEALEKLPPNYREVIILHHLEDRTFADVASQMGRSAEAVRKLWIRALGRLKQSLGEET